MRLPDEPLAPVCPVSTLRIVSQGTNQMENNMRKLLGAIAISAAALAATSAFPENTVREHRAEMERVWDNSQVRAAGPDNFLGRIFGQIEFRFVNPGMAVRLEGFEAEESRALLGFLFGHATQHKFIYRHRWRQGDVVIWDNRSLIHYAVCDYGDQPRYMERTTGIGEVPV